MTEFDRCAPWLRAALEYAGGTHTLDDVRAGVASGYMQLWPAPRGCAVTEIVVYPQSKALHIFLAAGELDQLQDMFDSAAAWGRDQGCDRITLSGRVGWKRTLEPLGWGTTAVVMERKI